MNEVLFDNSLTKDLGQIKKTSSCGWYL